MVTWDGHTIIPKLACSKSGNPKAIVGLGLSCLTNVHGCKFSSIYSGDDCSKNSVQSVPGRAQRQPVFVRWVCCFFTLKNDGFRESLPQQHLDGGYPIFIQLPIGEGSYHFVVDSLVDSYGFSINIQLNMLCQDSVHQF